MARAKRPSADTPPEILSELRDILTTVSASGTRVTAQDRPELHARLVSDMDGADVAFYLMDQDDPRLVRRGVLDVITAAPLPPAEQVFLLAWKAEERQMVALRANTVQQLLEHLQLAITWQETGTSEVRPLEFAPPVLTILSDQVSQAFVRGAWAPQEWTRPTNALPYYNDQATGIQVIMQPNGQASSASQETIAEASRTVLALDDKAVSAFIICMGKWFAETGGNLATREPARIHVADILGFRGIKKHVNGGYRPEQKEEAKADILLLRNIWVRSNEEVYEVNRKGKRQRVPVKVDHPLIEVSIESQPDLWGGESPYAFRVRPGDWAQHFLTEGTHWTTSVLRQIMRYDPYHERYAMRLGIYLAFHWRIRKNHGNWDQPWKLKTLLEGAKIEVPTRHPERFFPRVEAALYRLLKDGVVSACECLDPHTWPPPAAEGTPKQWVPRRLNDRWRLLPPENVMRPQLVSNAEPS
jgi:hypothetical protein